MGDLDEQLGIASSTLSHHLKELNRSGLIQMQRRGKQVLCSVNPATLADINNLFAIDFGGQQPANTVEETHGSETG